MSNSRFELLSAIDDIINQIKGGRFTLKQTDVSRIFMEVFFSVDTVP